LFFVAQRLALARRLRAADSGQAGSAFLECGVSTPLCRSGIAVTPSARPSSTAFVGALLAAPVATPRVALTHPGIQQI
jgi:hypothetical protein